MPRPSALGGNGGAAELASAHGVERMNGVYGGGAPHVRAHRLGLCDIHRSTRGARTSVGAALCTDGNANATGRKQRVGRGSFVRSSLRVRSGR